MGYSVGVVIGRFQVPTLHLAHQKLLRSVYHRDDRTLVLIGVPSIQGTWRNPLDYQSRAVMLQEFFGIDAEVTILPVHDRESDHVWSAQVDSLVSMVFPDADKVTLYHSRDGFGDHYHGQFECKDLSNEVKNIECSGTSIREACGSGPRSTEDFRRGVIYSTQHVWPYAKMAVDAIMYQEPVEVVGSHGHRIDGKIILGRKQHETKWRLPGGHVDPSDNTLELAVRRELHEETGMVCETTPVYICSRNVEDWRYGGLPNECIFTACFAIPYSHGAIKAADDLEEVKWFTFQEAYDVIRSDHLPLFMEFISRMFPKSVQIPLI